MNQLIIQMRKKQLENEQNNQVQINQNFSVQMSKTDSSNEPKNYSKEQNNCSIF